MAIDYRMIVGTKIDGTDIQQQIDKLPVKKIVIQATVKGSKEIKTMTDDMGSLVTTTTDFDKAGKKLGTTIDSVKTNFKDTSNQIKTASTHTETLAGKFVDITKKVVAFGAVTSLIGAFTKSMYEAVESVKVMDESLTELKKVTDLSGDGLENYTDQAFAMARDLKTTASDVTDAVTEFAKSNYTLEESQVLAKQAIIFQTIADGAISASDSATMLIQVMKAYNMTVSDSEHIINAINEVSNKYAVSSTDLSSSIGRVASSAKMAGVEFNQLLGLITGSNEIVQDAGKTANGYKTILTNLMTKDLEKQFNEFQLTMRKQNGELKSGYDMLIELGQAYNSLGTTWSEDDEAMISLNDSMNKLMKDIAGSFNINVLTAGFQNVKTTINATESAMNSAGSATDEYAVAMDSISKKIEGLKGSFQELAWGDGGLQGLIKGFLDAGTGILKFANSDVGQVIIRMGVLVVAITLAQKAFTSLNATMIASVAGVSKEVAMIAVANGATIGLSGAIDVLTASIMANPLLWGAVAVVGAVGAVTAIIKNYKTEQEKLSEQHEESIKQAKEKIQLYDEEKQKLESLTSQYESNISKINELKNSRNTENNSILKSYELQNGALEKQIEYEKTLLGLANEKAEKEAVGTLGEKTQKGYTSSGEEGYVTDSEKIRQNTESIKAFQKSIEDYQIVLNGQQLPTDKVEIYQKSIDNLNKQISDGIIVEDESVKKRKQVWQGLVDGTLTVEQYNDATETTQNSIKGLIEENSNLIPNVETLNNSIYSTSGANKELKDSNQKIIDSAKNVASEYGTASGLLETYGEDIEETASSLEILNDAIDSLQSDYSSLTSIVDEYNLNNGLSIDSVQKLLSLTEEYGSALSIQNGQLVLNDEVLQERANALLNNAKQEVYSQTMTKLNAIAQSDVATAMKIAKGEIDATTDSLETNANAYNTASVSAYAYQILNGQGQKASAVTKVLSDMETQIALVESAISGMGSNFEGSMGKANSEAKKLKSTVESLLKERIQEDIDKLKDAEEAEVKVLKKRIKVLKDNKKTQIDAVDDQIDAINKLKKAEEKRVEDKISALKKEKKAEKERVEDEISAFKKEKKAEEKRVEDKISALKKEKKAEKERVEDEISAFKKEKKAEKERVEDKISALKKEKKAEKERVEDEISAFKKEKKAEEKRVEDKISAFKKEKKAVSSYYDAEIAKLQKANTELDRNNKLMELQQNLALAQSSKVMVMGESGKFEYQSDEGAIASAEEELYQYQQELALEQQVESLQAMKDTAIASLDAQISKWEEYKTYMSENYQSQIDSLNEYKQTVQDGYDEQIEALEENVKATKEQYDEQIEALEENVEATKEQYDKQIEALEENVEATKEQYDKQIEALEENVEATKEQYDKQIEALKESIEAIQEQYDKQIEVLKESIEAIQEQYDKQIEVLEESVETTKEQYKEQIKTLENYKDNVEEFVDTLSKAEQRQLKKQLDTIKKTASNYETDLKNLKDYVNKYNAMLAKKSQAGATVSTSTSIGAKKTVPTSTSIGAKKTVPKSTSVGAKKYARGKSVVSSTAESHKARGYASGTSGVSSNEVAFVGDAPNTEMVVGSKANGTLMNLAKGTGVVNAESTKTFAGMLNSLSKNSSISGLTSEIANSSTNNSNTSVVIQNVTLPSVTNAQSFVDELKGFSANMTQYAYSN